MKKFTEAVLNYAVRPNPLLSLAEDGHSPEEIKQGIIAALRPYFRNQDLIERHAIDFLAGEVVNLAHVQSDPYSQAVFEHARELYLHAYAIDREATIRCCADSEAHIASGVAEYWSLLYLEIPKNELDLPELKHEIFRHIGTMLEACIQPILKEMLVMLRIARGKTRNYADTLDVSLGQVVGELADATRREDIYSPLPWSIPLNQWRNISQHYKATTTGEQVMIVAGKGKNQKRLSLSRDELHQILRMVTSHHRAVRLTRSLFFTDNLVEIGPLLTDVSPRPESAIFTFVVAVSTQGFKVMDVQLTTSEVQVWLTDLRPESQPERMIHASQLVYPLWINTGATVSRIHYLKSAEDAAVTFSATAEDCAAFANETISTGEFATRVMSSAGKLPDYAFRGPSST